MNHRGIINATLDRGKLETLCRRGAARAAGLGRPVLVSLTTAHEARSDGLDLFGRAAEPSARRWLWYRPERDAWLAGHGPATEITASDNDPMATIKRQQKTLLAEAVIDGEGDGPVFCGGFRYDPQVRPSATWEGFQEARFTVPQFLFRRTEGRQQLTVSALVEAESDVHELVDTLLGRLLRLETGRTAGHGQPSITNVIEASREEWRRRVATALEGIEAGTISKVVLSRHRELKSDGPFSPETALACLARAYPSCTIFAAGRGETVFLGASPEGLASVGDGQVAVTCLASSAPRGATPDEDGAYRRYLLEDRKERREHAAVAGMLADTLRGMCRELQWQEVPQVMKLKNIQHLFTPFEGKLRAGVHILDIVGRLHPTPAVAGVPTEPALALIRELEGDRGWYAAPVGWFDREGGEFVVGIRSALLRGDTAHLYAGCGIVAGSEPDREYRETELKFQPLLTALAAERPHGQ